MPSNPASLPQNQYSPLSLGKSESLQGNGRQHVNFAPCCSAAVSLEMLCTLINFPSPLVAVSMVHTWNIRKTVNPAHLFPLTSKSILRGHLSTRNYWHGRQDCGKIEAYGRIHMRADCFFSSECLVRLSTLAACGSHSLWSQRKPCNTQHALHLLSPYTADFWFQSGLSLEVGPSLSHELIKHLWLFPSAS